MVTLVQSVKFRCLEHIAKWGHLSVGGNAELEVGLEDFSE